MEAGSDIFSNAAGNEGGVEAERAALGKNPAPELWQALMASSHVPLRSCAYAACHCPCLPPAAALLCPSWEFFILQAASEVVPPRSSI